MTERINEKDKVEFNKQAQAGKRTIAAKAPLSLCCICCEDEDHSQRSGCAHFQKCKQWSERTTVTGKGPGGTLRRDFNHVNVELSLLAKKNRGSGLTSGGEIERNWLLFALSIVTCGTRPGCYTGLPLHDEVCARSHPHQRVIQESGSLVEMQTYLGEKYILRVWMRSGVCLLNISSPGR